jgi:hypothetical protein
MTIKESFGPAEKSNHIGSGSNKARRDAERRASRKTATIVGLLYIAATAAGLLSVIFMPDLGAHDYLTRLPANANPLFSGALLEFLMAVLIIGIAITLYPILKRFSETLALGYLVARIVESAIFILGAISLLTLLTLSRELASAGIPDAAYFQTTGALLQAVREWGGGVFSAIVFSLSALILNYILYRSRLVPRWLSVWGLIGATLYLASGFLPLTGQGTESTIYVLMEAPLGLQEMAFAVWLIVKGFNPAAVAPDSSEEDKDVIGQPVTA